MAALSAVLLAAGYGTRLYPLTKDCPKALLPLGGGVILDPLMEALAAVPGLSKAVLVTNHRFVKQFQAWQSPRTLNLEVIDDGSTTPENRLGAIRDLIMGAAEIPASDDLLVLGTDNLFSWSLADFVGFAKQQRPAPTIGAWRVSSNREASQLGVMELDRQGRVRRFLEKPHRPPALTVALCVYYFPAALRPRFEEFVAAGGNADAPGYFLEWLVEREPVYGYVAGGEWFEIGSHEAYDHAVQRWASLSSLRSPSR
jgi:glucose-1-phosphate thymidylyltransferase